LISFDNVTALYPGGIKGISDASFTLAEHSFTALVGPSGAGKSTILWILMGELIPSEGRVSCMGVNPAVLKNRALLQYRRHIGFVPQDLLLFGRRTVFDNVNIILRGMGLGRREADLRTQNVLDIVGLRERERAYPAQLSGGEQQRIAIARALGVNPRLLLADEPTGNLDPDLSAEIFELFRKINQMGITVLVATHEQELARSIGADMLRLSNRNIEHIPKEQVV